MNMIKTVKIFLSYLFKQRTERELIKELIDLRLRMGRVDDVCDKFKDPLLYHGECYYASGVDRLLKEIKDLVKLR